MAWINTSTLKSKRFKCGHCGEYISSQVGYINKGRELVIYICHSCDCPNVFYENKRYPGEIFGNEVKGLPEDIKNLYEEARRCVGINAFTASVMACRKLLMNIAVEKGAKEGQSFIIYIDYLDEKHFVPPDGKEWVDLIRTKGNEANHEIKIMGREDAEELILFIEMLLKFIYEFPSKIKKKDSQ